MNWLKPSSPEAAPARPGAEATAPAIAFGMASPAPSDWIMPGRKSTIGTCAPASSSVAESRRPRERQQRAAHQHALGAEAGADPAGEEVRHHEGGRRA